MSYKEIGVCSINKEHRYENWGNNAEPVNSGRCCHDCNARVVLPCRIYGQQMAEVMGRLGSSNSPAKAKAARVNGKKGGRPAKK